MKERQTINVYIVTWFNQGSSGIVSVHKDFMEANEVSWKDPRYCEVYEEVLND